MTASLVRLPQCNDLLIILAMNDLFNTKVLFSCSMHLIFKGAIDMLLAINLLKFTTFQMCDVCLYQCASKPILNRSFSEKFNKDWYSVSWRPKPRKKKKKKARERERKHVFNRLHHTSLFLTCHHVFVLIIIIVIFIPPIICSAEAV